MDSTLLSVLHPRQVGQSTGWGSPSAGAAWVRWGAFSALASLKQVFGLGETLAIRIAAKVRAYTYACLINRVLGRPQGRIEELWA